MAVELEIKLTLHADQLPVAVAWLLKQPEANRKNDRQLTNRYYDTPDRQLSQQRIALRLRHVGNKTIQTLKTQGEFVSGAHRRNEWEWQVPGPHLQLNLLADTPLSNTVKLARLAPVFETNFKRQIIMLTDQSSVIEVAVDNGEVIAGNQRRELSEVELELKAGRADRLLYWAQKLAQHCAVFVNLVSKAEQGYFLARGDTSDSLSCRTQGCRNLGAEPDSLSVFLHRLSQSWLHQRVVDTTGLDFDNLRKRAALSGLAQEWAQLETQLHDQKQVNELLQHTLLGRIQLAILQQATVDKSV